MFIGRELELAQIRECFASERKSAMMLYGKRRVGKSFLILEAIKNINCKVIYYECLITSIEDNLRNLEAKVKQVFNNKYLHFTSFGELFDFLNSVDERIVIVIDEYSYLKQVSNGKLVDSTFQSIIDQMHDNVKLVLLGSYVGMMRELLEGENPLFGRFDLVLNVLPLDYYDSAKFYSNVDIKQKISLYCIFGGLPFINALLQTEKNIETNIIKLILNNSSPVRMYIENVLLSELGKLASANLILSALANGKKKYGELQTYLGIAATGALDKQLKNLLDMEVIRKVYPINKKGDKRKTFYEIADNLVRFYYSYVYNNQDVISRVGEKTFYDLYIKPSQTTFIAHRFEEMAREYFIRKVRMGMLKDIYDVGTFWYDVPKEHRSGEFDCVLQHANGYSFYEVKLYDRQLSLMEVEQEEQQVRILADFVNIERLGFITLQGFSFASDKYDLINAEQLYRL